MSDPRTHDASLAAAVLALDPIGIGGIRLRTPAGPHRDRWIDRLREMAGAIPTLRLPPSVTPDRLLAGLDLVATLAAGRPIIARGILAEMNGGLLVLPMAERLPTATAAIIGCALEDHVVPVERDGASLSVEARFAVLALDEGLSPEEAPAAALLDRLAVHIELEPQAIVTAAFDLPSARTLLPQVEIPPELLETLVATAQALGILSMRPCLQAVAVARAAAALAGRLHVASEDAEAAARLVLAPRALQLPVVDSEPGPSEVRGKSENSENSEEADVTERALAEQILAAAVASLPPSLLADLAAKRTRATRSTPSGKCGERERAKRGRAVGARPGDLHHGERLDLLSTLRAAAPWQRLRRARSGVFQVRREDFRLAVLEHRRETTAIFLVDASGSAALHRLAEAKGAVELLLQECYVRRDQVALIAFRGAGADLLLPPTRSLVRARRTLAALPGGGGTPLAAGLDASMAMAMAARREGRTPILVVMTDGRANVARDGRGDRRQAEADADKAARSIAAAGFKSLLIDTSPRPHPLAEHVAGMLAGTYLPLPYADANRLSQHVQQAMHG